jgi:hypothetical protein
MHMKGRLVLCTLALTAMVGLALAPAGSGAGTVTKVKCSASYTSLTPGKLTGEDVGLVSCGKPFGKGIQWVKYTETVSATGAVTAHGPFKAWSDLGTVHGTYKLAGKLMGATGSVSGTSRITGGTGAFKGAKGTGTQTCHTTDAGATLSCKFTLRFTRL